MTANIIYFENVFPAAQEVIESVKGPDLNLIYWCKLSEAEKEYHLSKAHYLVTSIYKITRELLEKAPHVRLIQRNGIGVDNIDVKAADELGIMVANTPGVNASAVAELTIGMILCLYRKLNFLDRETKSGKWLMWEYRPFMFEMKGKTHGIIGMGSIGKEVARLSRAFGTEVIYFNRTRLTPEVEKELGITYVPFNELLAKADIASLHLPFVPETEGLIGKKELNLMKPNAVLINVARGNVVDESALNEALTQGKLLGAGIDTWAVEPTALDNLLLKHDNVVATPHIGGGTRDALQAVFKMTFLNISKVENGLLPDHLVGKVRSKKI
jgi:lactate dehydrogenase-like 2-hydroxyacid dehydrogenase